MQNLNCKNIIFNILFALACLVSVCLLWRKTFLLTVVLVIISVTGLCKWKSKVTTVLFIICGIWGAVAEIIVIYSGAWAYTLPNILGIPHWLPVLWGDAAVFSYQIAIEIKNLKL